MNNMITTIRIPAAIGLLLTLPFMAMEWANRRNFNEGFPIPLFGILWFLSAAFIAILALMIRTVQAGEKLTTHPLNLTLKVLALGLILFLWVGIVSDQLPCFLGASNCD